MHRCYDLTRQAMLEEISRLDAEVKNLQRIKVFAIKCKKRNKKLKQDLHKMNSLMCKVLSDL